jgi:NAD(P)-dependent dehydrogenase (short-subunit alcohol dehydrogenase family)
MECEISLAVGGFAVISRRTSRRWTLVRGGSSNAESAVNPTGARRPEDFRYHPFAFADQVDAMTAQRERNAFGRIDILVHSAGILRPAGASPRISAADGNRRVRCALIDINLKGTFLCDRSPCLQYMMAQRSGQILNIASTSGLKGVAFDSVYCASKFGVVGLTESLAEEVRQFGVRVHLLLPDAVATPLWDNNIAGAPAGSLSPGPRGVRD